MWIWSIENSFSNTLHCRVVVNLISLLHNRSWWNEVEIFLILSLFYPFPLTPIKHLPLLEYFMGTHLFICSLIFPLVFNRYYPLSQRKKACVHIPALFLPAQWGAFICLFKFKFCFSNFIFSFFPVPFCLF